MSRHIGGGRCKAHVQKESGCGEKMEKMEKNSHYIRDRRDHTNPKILSTLLWFGYVAQRLNQSVTET